MSGDEKTKDEITSREVDHEEAPTTFARKVEEENAPDPEELLSELKNQNK